MHHAQHWARPGGAGAGQLPGDVRRLPRLLGPGADMSIHIYRYLHIYIYTYLNYQYICRVTTPSCCRGRPPVPTRALPPPGPTWASVTYQTRMASNSRHQEKNKKHTISSKIYILCLLLILFFLHGINGASVFNFFLNEQKIISVMFVLTPWLL